MTERERQDSVHFWDYWRVVGSRKEIVAAVFLLVVATGILFIYSTPKVYMASTLIQVREETPDVKIWGEQVVRFDPLFLRTQFEIVRSRPVLEETITRLNLNDKLGRAYGYLETLGEQSIEQTVKILAKRMKVQQYRDTNLMEIQIYMDEPKETVTSDAAQVANMVAEVFRDLNMRRSRANTERALKALQETLDKHRLEVDEKEEEVERIRNEYELDVIGADGDANSVLKTRSLVRLEEERIKVRMELADKEARYNEIKNQKRDKLLATVPHLFKDPVLSQLVADKTEHEIAMKRHQPDLGTKHPEVVRVVAIITELDKKIDAQLEGLKTGVRADYEAMKQKYDILVGELDAARTKERHGHSEGYRKFEKAKEELDRVRRIRDALESRHVMEQIEMRIPKTTVQVIEPAKPPDRDDPVSPDVMLNLVLSILVGLAAGVGLAFFIEYLDTSVKTIEDIERYMGASALGVIPQKVRPFCEDPIDSAHAEAYRVLRTNIQFSKDLKGGKTICVTSGSVGEGKSLTIFNLAYTCAQMGDKTLIVDSDLHRPRQHKILGVSNRSGLANVLVGEATLEECTIATKNSNLDFLSSGKLASGVHGLLDTRKMRDLVRELKENYDLIFFDAPPMIGISDTSLLVREMDAVMLVIQHRKYPRAVSTRARDMVQNVGANFIGVVLNNINISRDHSYYYYYHHYYAYPEGSGKKRKA